MPIDPLSLLEFFTEEISVLEEKSADLDFYSPQHAGDSFFCEPAAHSYECISLENLLKDQCNFLQALAFQWQQEQRLPWQFLLKVDAFINENTKDFDAPEIKVRKILDFVYTVV